MTSLYNTLVNAVPAPLVDGSGAPVQYGYDGNPVGVARTEDQRSAALATQLMAMRDAGGSAGVMDAPRMDADDRRTALPILARFGVELPPLIEEANTRSGQVELALVPDRRDLDILTVPVDEIGARVSELIESRQREEFLNTVSRDLRNQAARGVVDAFRGSLSYVLAAKPIRAEFDAARDAFLDSFPTVQGCRSLGDAAALDETGAGVAAWHAARRSVARMDEIVSVLVTFAAPRKQVAQGTLRRLMEPGQILGLSAAPVDTTDYLVALGARGIEWSEYFRKPVDEPFGVYGAQVEAGAVLSLPVDAADLIERAAEFNPYAAIADAMYANG